jgi:hypothetical protein
MVRFAINKKKGQKLSIRTEVKVVKTRLGVDDHLYPVMTFEVLYQNQKKKNTHQSSF